MIPIPGFEAYSITRDGRIWSSKVDRWLKDRPNVRNGRLEVRLYVDGHAHEKSIHSLVALTFIGPRPDGMVVRHLDGDKLNNRTSNLKYGTHSENVLDQVTHGVHNMASRVECKNGHPYTAESTYLPPGGGRACRICRTEASRRSRAKKR